jgi:ABC-2 type transport system permease protein
MGWGMDESMLTAVPSDAWADKRRGGGLSLGWLASMSLARREIVRFVRQRSRVASALGSPVVFWALIGLGLGRSFSPPGSTQDVGYLEYFFPGTLVLILLFSSVFSNISLIEDRREGFLQGVLVSPAPRSSIVLGKILGGTILAWGQGMLFCLYLLTPWSEIAVTVWAMIALAAVLFVVAFAMAGMGFLIAWPMDSTHGFHAIMNLILIPMWLLSGALFPASGAPVWLQWVIAVNPVTYCVLAVQWVLYEDVAAVTGGSPPSAWVAFLITGIFAAGVFVASILVARSASRKN